MDSDASASPVPTEKASNSEEPVKIKKEFIDPDYNAASTAFEVTTKILASDIKSETEIKTEIKWEPMEANENENQDDKPKMPVPKAEVKKNDDTQAPSKKTRLRRPRAGRRKQQKMNAYEFANSSGYYPPASVIWQRVPYLKPRHIKTRAPGQYYMGGNRSQLYWGSRKHYTLNRSQTQPNKDHSTNKLHIIEVEDSSPSDDNMDNDNPLSNSTETSDKAYFFMLVENLPLTWNEAQVKEFLEKENVSVKDFEMMKDSDSKFIGDIQIEFETFEQCEEARKKLHGKEVEEKKLSAEFNDPSNVSDSDSEYSEPSFKRKKVNIDAAYRPDIDVWESDPKGLYGLKPEFLQSLGITPPIGRWVQVTNFRCNKEDLKEVMDLAGDVQLCTILTINHKIAKVMYSHPLEAVQAVSMLNKKNFYSTPLNVVMEHCPDRQIILPKGLQEVGPGLGQNGNTLRDIVRQYERFAKGQSTSINFDIFRDINFKMDSSDCDVDSKSASSDIGAVQPKNEPESDKKEGNGTLLPNPCNPTVQQTIVARPRSGGPMPGSNGPVSGPSTSKPGQSSSMSGNSSQASIASASMSGSVGSKSRPCGPMSGLNSPMPVNRGPIRNQMRPNIRPMPYPMPMRPGFGPNPMLAQASRIPRQMGPMPGQMGPVAGQFQVPGPPGHFPVHPQIPGLMVHQPGPMMNQPGPMMNQHGPMINQPGPMANQPHPMVNQPGPMANQPRPMANQPGPMANQPGSMVNQPGPMANQPLPVANQPGPIANQPRPMGNQPGPMANQPGPMANQPGHMVNQPGPMASQFPNQPQPPGVSDSPRKPGPIGPGSRPMANNVPAMTMSGANCPGPMAQSRGNCTVEISNLPPNTTFSVLSEKLSSCGPLMSLQINCDRALAQFATRGHAENCYKQFNQLKVFGNTLQVKFV